MSSRGSALLVISIAAAIAAAAHGPVVQDPAYHAFADARPFLGIPHFADVISNIPFLLAGLLGLRRRGSDAAYRAMSLGILLVGFGSAYYHWAPTDATLAWDRLPMTIAFMGLFAAVLEDSRAAGFPALLPLLAAGACSVLYWRWTGDLRPYLLVQFLPLLLLPLVLALYERRDHDGRLLIAALGLYAAAKVFEHFDRAVFSAFFLSGHTLKHLFAGAASWLLIEACARPPRLLNYGSR